MRDRVLKCPAGLFTSCMTCDQLSGILEERSKIDRLKGEGAGKQIGAAYPPALPSSQSSCSCDLLVGHRAFDSVKCAVALASHCWLCVRVCLSVSLPLLVTDRGTLEQFVSHPSCVLPCLGCSRPRMENFSSRLLSCMPPPFLYCTSASRSFAAHWLSLSLSLLRLCVPGGCLRRGHFLTELARALDTTDQARSDGV